MLDFWQVEYLSICEAVYNKLELDMTGGTKFQYSQPSLDIQVGLIVENLNIWNL